MDSIIPLIVGAVIVALAFALFALLQAVSANKLVEELRARLRELEGEVRTLRRQPEQPKPEQPRPEPPPRPVAIILPPAPEPPPIHVPPPIPRPVVPPPPVPVSKPKLDPVFIPRETFVPPVPQPEPAHAQPPSTEGWEEFMGAKLFAWIGGLALFLGIAFFVKYSFEHNLIPPEARVAIGFLCGIGLLAGGAMMKRKENVVTAQTLCATGILVLYAVTYACRSYYHFPFFAVTRTFALMALITAIAFITAERMNAMVVAVLGVAGGFLTPELLYTGQDYPLALFGYIAALDIGLLAIARRQHWQALPWLGAIGTVATHGIWLATFFVPEHYFAGNKVLIAMAVLLGFQALFLAAAWRARSLVATHGSALLVGGVAILTSFYFLGFPTLGSRPILLCGYLFLADIALIALSLVAEPLAAIQGCAGAVAFIFLGAWTETHLTGFQLAPALGCYFLFGLLHGMMPLILRRGKSTPVPAWCHLFPIASLVLVLLPILQLDNLSLILWPFVLLIDFVAFVIAILTGMLAPFLAVLVLTLIALGGALLQAPPDLAGLNSDLCLIGVFAILFVGANAWARRRIKAEGIAGQLPALSALMPFVLLIMAILKLPLHDPSPVFALALLLVMLLLGLAAWLMLDALPLVALGAVLALQYAWLAGPISLDHPLIAFRWGLVYYTVFTLFPFFFRTRFAEKKAPWIASALAGPLHFYLIRWAVDLVLPNLPHGLPPAMLAIPPLAALAYLHKRHANQTQLAFFGGVGLFFVTLIFPLQFHREWITISWALEGAALCWLFHRVPHRGLRLTGVALLVTSFARLAFNPFILGYHARAAVPIFNWFLYTFGAVAVAQFLAARLLAKPRNLIAGINVQPLLYTLGTVLCFLLVNIEIADFFTAPGDRMLNVDFSGIIARDMTYSIAWALFALLLLFIGNRNCTPENPEPHPGMRLGALALLAGSFARLAYILTYHAHAGRLIFNGYLLAFAIVAAVQFLAARLLAKPRNLIDGINVQPLPNTLGTILCFLLVNIEIANYFTAPGDPVLTFEFSGNFARDMSASIAWALFALVLLIIGIRRRNAPVRYASIALLGVTVLKLFLHDLSELDQLYRIGAFIAVAIIAMVASFLYQRFFARTPATPEG